MIVFFDNNFWVGGFGFLGGSKRGGEGEGGGGRRWLGWRRFRGGEETGREGGGLFLFPFWGEGGGGWEGGGGDWHWRNIINIICNYY